MSTAAHQHLPCEARDKSSLRGRCHQPTWPGRAGWQGDLESLVHTLVFWGLPFSSLDASEPAVLCAAPHIGQTAWTAPEISFEALCCNWEPLPQASPHLVEPLHLHPTSWNPTISHPPHSHSILTAQARCCLCQVHLSPQGCCNKDSLGGVLGPFPSPPQGCSAPYSHPSLPETPHSGPLHPTPPHAHPRAFAQVALIAPRALPPSPAALAP